MAERKVFSARLNDDERAFVERTIAALKSGKIDPKSENEPSILGVTNSSVSTEGGVNASEGGSGGDDPVNVDEATGTGGVWIGSPPPDDSEDEKGGRRPRRKPEIDGWEDYVGVVSKLPSSRTETARETTLQYLALWPEGSRGAFQAPGEGDVTSPSYCDRLFELDVNGRLDPDEIRHLLSIPQPIARAFYIDLIIDHGSGLQPKKGYS